MAREHPFWNFAGQAAARPHDETLLGAWADHLAETGDGGEHDTIREHVIRHGVPPRRVDRTEGEDRTRGAGVGSHYVPMPPPVLGVALRESKDAPMLHELEDSGVQVEPTRFESYHLFHGRQLDKPLSATASRPILLYTLKAAPGKRTLRLAAPVTREHLHKLADLAEDEKTAEKIRNIADYHYGDSPEIHKTAHKLARERAPATGAVRNNSYTPAGQFLPRTLKRIRDVAARLVKLARPKKEPVVRALTAAQKAFKAFLDKNPVLGGVYGFKDVSDAYKQGRRLTPGEVDGIERALEMPEHLRLPKDRRSDVAERMIWLNEVHDRLNGELGLSRLLKRKDLPEHLRTLFHRAAKLGALLHFHHAWKEGAGEVLDPLEWYDKTMNPMHVLWHESYAHPGTADPMWGALDKHREKLESGGRPLWDHAPSQALATVITGVTSPGATPHQNGKTAHRIVDRAVKAARAAGTHNWIEHIPQNQDDRLAEWRHEHRVDDPDVKPDNHARLIAWQQNLPLAARQNNPGYKSRALVSVNGEVVGTSDKAAEHKVRFFDAEGRKKYEAELVKNGRKSRNIRNHPGVPLVDAAGRLQPKEWSTNESVGAALGKIKEVLAHVRAKQPHLAAMKEGPEKQRAEVRAVAEWLLTKHPRAEVEGVAGRKLDQSFRAKEPELFGTHATGPKVGEFSAGLAGPEYTDTHVQDMHEARRAEAVQGTAALKGKYHDDKVVGYNNLKRRVLRAAARHSLAFLKEHHPDHPVLKHPDNTRAVQALEWIAQKSLVDDDGVLDFHSKSPAVGGINSDYVSAANHLLAPKYGGKDVFTAAGRRVRTSAKDPAPQKTGLAVRQKQGEQPERLSKNVLDKLPPALRELVLARLLASGLDYPFPRWAVAQALAAVGGPARLARPSATAEHVVYVSPSDRENSTFEQAARNLNGPAVTKLREQAMLLPTVRAAHAALGYWKDGAEESAAVHVGDPQYLPRVAATLGKAWRQKGVLWFHEHPDGQDARHVIVVPDTDPQKIHDDMMRHGIEYKTLVPMGGKTRVEAVDQGDSMRPEFLGYAAEAGALSHAIKAGHAHFVGGDSREEAAAEYEKLLGT